MTTVTKLIYYSSVRPMRHCVLSTRTQVEETMH